MKDKNTTIPFEADEIMYSFLKSNGAPLTDSKLKWIKHTELEGKITLIDARGVTTNYDEFIPKRPPGTLFDDNPSGQAFVRAPKCPGYGARRASQGWRGRE